MDIPARESQYRPINAYGVTGNCRTALLIGPDGSVDWGCLPDFDSPALFCRLLDAERGGYFQIAPRDTTIAGSQEYVRGSNVLQTRFRSDTGEVIVTDFMPVKSLHAVATGKEEAGESHCLVRRVECTTGMLTMAMTLKVTPQYAGEPCDVSLLEERYSAVLYGGGQYVRLAVSGASSLSAWAMWVEDTEDGMGKTVQAMWMLHAGERVVFVLGASENQEDARRLIEEEVPRRDFAEELSSTLECWRRWIARCTYHGPYVEAVQRSALVLKMMTYRPTGAIVAAPTTSLPESPGGGRNWDYRYTWLRDASFTLNSLHTLGFGGETQAFLNWLSRLACENGNDVQIMYGIRGERTLTERILGHLSGYRDSWPVRIGNGAAEQKQLDIFGEVLDCIHRFHCCNSGLGSDETLPEPLWRLICLLVEHVCAHWREKDAGIWEVRGGPRHFVYSKVMCWVAVERGIRIAEHFEMKADVPCWRRVLEDIRVEVLARGYNSKVGAFTQSYESDALDAACLLLPLVGFIEPEDARMRSTVERIMEQLTDEDGFVYRYHADDGLSGEEGTFALCTFWLIDNLALQGRIAEAEALFERILTYAGPCGLFSEEIDTKAHLALGNYPQAFTHLGLINSAWYLERAREQTRERAEQETRQQTGQIDLTEGIFLSTI